MSEATETLDTPRAANPMQAVVMPKSPELREIVSAYLAEHGFDGLFDLDGECACAIDDLFPCGNPTMNCAAGYEKPCDCGDHDWHIGPRDGA